MKKFTFKLQQVLEYKKHLEKRKQQELATILNRLDAAQKFLNQLIQQRTSCQQEMIHIEKKGCTQVELLMLEKFNQSLKKRIEHQNQVIAGIQEEYTTKQIELLEATKEKKSFEIYRSKKFEEYKKALLTFEQNYLDEIAIRQFNLSQRIG